MEETSRPGGDVTGATNRFARHMAMACREIDDDATEVDATCAMLMLVSFVDACGVTLKHKMRYSFSVKGHGCSDTDDAIRALMRHATVTGAMLSSSLGFVMARHSRDRAASIVAASERAWRESREQAETEGASDVVPTV